AELDKAKQQIVGLEGDKRRLEAEVAQKTTLITDLSLRIDALASQVGGNGQGARDTASASHADLVRHINTLQQELYAERERNKRLFKTVVAAQQPDRYLVVVRAPEVGRLAVGQPGWSSDDVWVIALSEWRQKQEAMLLMAAHGWVRSELGRYSLTPLEGRPWRARLELQVGEEG